MTLSRLVFVCLLILVAIFSVQNAGPVPVRFLVWEIRVSAALVIQLAGLLGALVGLTIGVRGRRRKARAAASEEAPTKPGNEAVLRTGS